MTKKTQKAAVPPALPAAHTEAKHRRGVENLIPFKKGDPRINRNGRPKSFDAVRALAQQIGAEGLGESGFTRIQALLVAMSTSRNPRDRELFLAYAYGKPENRVAVTATIDKIEGYDYGASVAALAPGSVGDCDASGAGENDSDGEAMG